MKTNKTSEAMVQDQNLTPYLTATNNNSQTPVLDEISDMMGIDAKKNPSITFWMIFFHKENLSKKEVINATGLSERWYNMVIDEHYSPGLRKIRASSLARQTLEKHLERKDLRYHQLLISELLWKVMMFLSIAERINNYSFNADLEEDDNTQDEPLDMTQYLITVEELEVAMNYFAAHLVVKYQSTAKKWN